MELIRDEMNKSSEATEPDRVVVHMRLVNGSKFCNCLNKLRTDGFFS